MVQLTGNPVRTACERLKSLTHESWSFVNNAYQCYPRNTSALDVISEQLADRVIACSGSSVGHKHQLTVPRDQTDRILAADMSGERHR